MSADYRPNFDDFFPKTRKGIGRIAPAIDRNGRERKFVEDHRHKPKGEGTDQEANVNDWKKDRGL